MCDKRIEKGSQFGIDMHKVGPWKHQREIRREKEMNWDSEKEGEGKSYLSVKILCKWRRMSTVFSPEYVKKVYWSGWVGAQSLKRCIFPWFDQFPESPLHHADLLFIPCTTTWNHFSQPSVSFFLAWHNWSLFLFLSITLQVHLSIFPSPANFPWSLSPIDPLVPHQASFILICYTIHRSSHLLWCAGAL